jgi:signal transduction histidine kinase
VERTRRETRRPLIVAAELTAMLYRDYPFALAGTVIVACLLTLVNWTPGRSTGLLLWLAALTCVHAIRLRRYLAFRRRPPTPDEAPDWARWFVKMMVLSGLVVGSTGVFLFETDMGPRHMITLCVLYVLAGGALRYYAYSPAAYYAFAVPMIGPLIARLMFSGSSTHMLMGSAGILLLLVANSFGRNMHLLLRESLFTRYEKIDLVDELSEQKAHADAARLEAEQARHEAEQANLAKSHFLAAASHDLRTPLNAVIGFSEVLQARMFGELNAKQSEYVDDIHSSGQHLLSLINDLLDLAKIESGKLDLDPVRFDVGSAIQDGMTLMRDMAARHGIALELDVAADTGTLVADPRMFKRVLINLLSNAVKFTPAGGRVTARAAREGAWIRVSVTDTGVGIAPEDQALIFQEFRQVGMDVRHRGEGTGLGLALSRKFVELHGGTIGVESRVGAGATFSFSLPADRLTEERAA